HSPTCTAGLPGSGIGIYDTVSQQKWEQDHGIFSAWSTSGRHLVFAGFVPINGVAWQPSSPNSEARPSKNSRAGAAPVNEVDELHYYAKSVTRLGESKAEPISPKEAMQLVGKWYRSALTYVVMGKSPGSHVYDQVVQGPAVIPGGRGAVLVDTYYAMEDKGDYGDHPPLPPSEIGYEWRALFIDPAGRSVVYDPFPQLGIVSWSRDGERVYGITGPTSRYSSGTIPFICIWVRSGRYATINLPGELKTVLSYTER
ncbi:MAG: hypothetical protein V4671_05040, partial [Armatimonadota bacterium]